MLKTKYKKWQKIMLRSKCQIVETTCKNNLQKQWQYNRKYGIMSLWCVYVAQGSPEMGSWVPLTYKIRRNKY